MPGPHERLVIDQHDPQRAWLRPCRSLASSAIDGDRPSLTPRRGIVARDPPATAGVAAGRELAAERPHPLVHAAHPEPDAPVGGGTAPPSRRPLRDHDVDVALCGLGASATVHARSGGVPQDVGQRLLHDAIDDQPDRRIDVDAVERRTASTSSPPAR